MPKELLLFLLLLVLTGLLIFLSQKRREHFQDTVVPPVAPISSSDATAVSSMPPTASSDTTVAPSVPSIPPAPSTGFDNAYSSYDLYEKNVSKEFDNQMFIYKDTVNDINELLLVYGCGINIGKAPEALDKLVEASAKGLYIVPFTVYTPNMTDVYTKAYNMIHEFYDKIGRNKIQGQIYFVISQSPYYRDEGNNPLAIQFSYTNYLSLPFNAASSTPTDTSPPIQFYCYMICTAYNKKAQLIEDTELRMLGVLNIKKNFRHKESVCFMRCPQHTNVPCGCASQDAPYITNCLESKNPGPMSSGKRYSYAILYRVNPRFSDLIARNIIEADYADYEWSPDELNPIPTSEDPDLPIPNPLRSSAEDGIVLYQNCNYKGQKSTFIPPGNYTLKHLQNYGIRGDVSSYKTYGNIKVRLYQTSNYKRRVDINEDEDKPSNDMPCFRDYMKLNDNMMSIRILPSSMSRTGELLEEPEEAEEGLPDDLFQQQLLLVQSGQSATSKKRKKQSKKQPKKLPKKQPKKKAKKSGKKPKKKGADNYKEPDYKEPDYYSTIPGEEEEMPINMNADMDYNEYDQVE